MNMLLRFGSRLWNLRRNRQAVRELVSLQKQEWELIAQTAENPLQAAKQALDRGDRPEAIRNWELAEIRFPDIVRSAPESVYVLLGLERFEEAEALIRDGQRIAPSEPYFAEASAYLSQRRGETEEALKRWEQARKRFPNQQVNYWRPAKFLCEIGRADEAERILRGVATKFPQSFLCLSTYAMVAEQREDWSEALKRWKLVLEAFDTHSNENRAGVTGAANSLQKMGRFVEAEQLLISAQNAYPFNREFRAELARTASEAGDWSTAVNRWSEIRRAEPGNPTGYLEEARALRQARRLFEAAAVLKEAAGRFPEIEAVAAESALVNHDRLVGTEETKTIDDEIVHGPAGIGVVDALTDSGTAIPRASLPDAQQTKQDSKETSVCRGSSLGHPRFSESFSIRFGTDGTAAPYLTSGWALPEDGYTFSVGGEARLSLPALTAPFGMVLELTLHSFVCAGHLPAQRILIRVNGQPAGHSAISEFTTVAFLLPTSLSGSDMHITVEQPDAARPSDITGSHDDRHLGVAFHEVRVYVVGATLLPKYGPRQIQTNLRHLPDLEAIQKVQELVGAAKDELVKEFESLGENCELGLLQRVCGAEPLGMLRFSTVYLAPLIMGIKDSFSGVDEPAHILPVLEDDPKEWMVRHRLYDLRYHTFKREHEATESEIRAREIKRLRFLKDKFLVDLTDGIKTFVYKRTTQPLQFEEVLPLFIALNAHGDNCLLWVIPAVTPYAPGTVEELMPGLFRGHIDRFPSVHTPGELSEMGWLEVCVSTLRLRRMSSKSD